MARLEIVTQVLIRAPARTVWSILTDLGRMSEWNPFIIDAEGEARAGSRLAVRIRPPGGKPVRFRPTVLVAESEREFRWLGRVLVPGLFNGEHYFLLEPDGAGTRLTHGEIFSGLLVGPMDRRGQFGPIRAGYEAMNQALKLRAEAQAEAAASAAP